MPPSPKQRVSLKAVATASGHALATVSYALRNSGKIPEATRRAIQRTAVELGYRANPRISNLMSYVRGKQQMQFGERIAFVWVHCSRVLARRDPFLVPVFEGARRRAEQAGFAMDEFFTSDPGMSDRRLEQILHARGVVGVVLSPVTTNEATLTLDWDWSAFAPAVIGNVAWTPELHHAGHHHYLGMRTAIGELEKLECRRPAAIIEPESNTRAKRAWEAAFLTHHPDASNARTLVQVPQEDQKRTLAAWLRQVRPDALIVSATALLDAPGVKALCTEFRLPIVTLYWDREPPGIAGIDQCYDRIAGHAVDLVIAQLNSNETGVPDMPRMMLFPGRWVAPHIAAPSNSRTLHAKTRQSSMDSVAPR